MDRSGNSETSGKCKDDMKEADKVEVNLSVAVTRGRMSDIGIGRGRGRGHEQQAARDSSTSGKRVSEGDSDNGNRKRGLMRDNRVLPSAPLKTRPKCAENSKEGVSGTPVVLKANYFKVIQGKDFQVTQYHVEFNPEIDLAGMRKAFLRQQVDYLGGYVYDGQSILYTTRKLAQEVAEFKITSREGVQYSMTIKATGVTVDINDHKVSQIYNIILRSAMNGLNLQLVGRHLYDPQNKVSLREFHIDLWPGYITSIRQHERDVLVCCEISHKVMRQETIYEILRDHKSQGDRWQENFKKEVIGSVVLTDYNNKTYRVDDVDFGSSPSATFEKGEHKMTFFDYYKSKYRVDIRDRNQPMLVSNPKASDVRAGRTGVLLLVPELCRATGLTDKQRSNYTMARAMADHTQMPPQTRSERLTDLRRRLDQSLDSKAQLANFNTDIDRRIVTFNGRALKQETMLFGGGRTSDNDHTVDWTNPMKSNQMFQPLALQRWVFVYPTRNAQESHNFLKLLQEVANGMHFEMSAPKMKELPDDRVGTYLKQVKEIVAMDPKLILIVLSNNSADRYAGIKKLTCVDKAIPTQCVVSRTMVPKKSGIGGVKSIATKVLIQMNCKLGGAPWMIKFPMRGVMTIGFDVTHDTKNRAKSYGAFVASMDLKEKVAYFSACSPHKDGEEVSANISNHLVAALKAYKDLHGTIPERIFFYRDGVGDGQIEFVYKNEVNRLKEKLTNVYGAFNKQPRFTFIIVNKRINTRIFMDKNNKLMNPVPGTIVDHTITLPERYDFFLVSQSVRQGTVAPTSYNVIEDTSGLSPDQIQVITYKNTHLYYNWSGCTRVPAVVQYAHKLAELVGTHLHESPAHFNNQLYFL
ncbi:CLUMA_CG013814, isoform A [Clunio marinus]|uniref:CLUMA_CG013814, isoform A n=1 Tax=Clunio marinus TaxID=568069 RepID=A0A1J1ILB4_9DIPT|nr:CLUMA_CG013814, isoform A [Clunio marinus]